MTSSGCSSARHLVSAKQEDLPPMDQVVPMKAIIMQVILRYDADVRVIFQATGYHAVGG